MIQEDKKLEYLKEHVWYELCQLRHDYDRMAKSEDVLDRNAFFASFAIHARSLYWFLTNNNNNEVRACDYTQKYRPPKGPKVANVTERINQQVAHLSSKRLVEEERRLNYRNCREISDWIEEHIALFAQALEEPFTSHFKPGKHEYKETTLTIQGVTASSATISMTSTVHPQQKS